MMPGASRRTSRQLLVDALVVVVVVVLVRLATFWSEVIDWDVGLYVTVAREVLHGNLPYVSAWEYRPPGLFFLLAAALAIFRSPTAAMAVLGVLAVCATSFALYGIGRIFTHHGRTVGLLAALFYATISIEDNGLAGNTEILFAPLLAWAVFIVLQARLGGRSLTAARTIMVGALVAAALQMKLMVLSEAAFIVVLAGWWARGGPKVGALIGGIALLPFVLEAVLYDVRSELQSFLDANVYATLRRAGVGTSAPSDNLRRILAQPYALFPASLLVLLAPFAYAASAKDSADRSIVKVLAAWLGVVALTLLLVREFNDHQFLELLPPLTLLAAFATVWLGERLRARRACAAVAFLIAFALHGYYQVVTGARLAYHRAILHDVQWHEANVDRIAARLRAAPAHFKTLFVVGETPIVYLLADAPLPTRFPFSLYLTDPEMWPLTGVDGREEVAHILASLPAFILRSDSQFHVDPYVDAQVAAALRSDYDLIGRFEHDSLYVRHDLRNRA